MPNKQIHISPNRPLYIALKDPNGEWDEERRQSTYETTSGEILVLPRPAVVALNLCGPAPGEEIVIQQHWDGLATSPREWTVTLSTRSEISRANEAQDSQDLTGGPRTSNQAPEPEQSPVAPPVPIRKPAKKGPTQEQPRLFDQRGTGTDGPAPKEAPRPIAARAIARYQKPAQIPANVAVREILAFINHDPNTRNWCDQASQGLASTILIAAYKAGHIGLWEREE